MADNEEIEIEKTSNAKRLFIQGSYYLDSKMQPVNSVAELYKIPLLQRFVGMEVTVIHDEYNGGELTKYWLNGGITNTYWKKKIYTGASYDVYGDDLELTVEE